MSPRLVALGLLATGGLIASLVAGEPGKTGTSEGFRQHDADRPKPPVVEPAEPTRSALPPEDAVVLFDGKTLDAWQSGNSGKAGWKVDGEVLEVSPGAGLIRTKETFGDAQVHIEWSSPNPPNGKGQDRGNTGLFLMGQFEVQMIDSYKADTYADGQAGAIYGQYPPLFNATRPPGEWQSYDVAFRRPRFDDDGKLLEPARLTLFHNGILVQNNEEILGPTNWLHWGPYKDRGDAGPIELQDHGHPVRFRNIWVRNLPTRPSPSPEALKRPEPLRLSEAELARFEGDYRMGSKENGTKVKIALANGHLTVKFAFLPNPLAIEPIAPNVFAMPDTDGEFTFREGTEGKITGARFVIGDGERSLFRVEK